ncbi:MULTISPECIES: response regulator transcription factor [unclassified Ruegeria]|uniref:response regulator n=1 Tax=unclassified Ruegeria TaxID=2625375 RepID=UPI001488C285|nr:MULTISPECIES: response regulator transcription factor [unclassified Ruegeria]NOD76879.1 response regulator [Ruegeria sp. HKCCD4332]NOD88402.1 response regulator [Ruegeria sp. HKCCD4318]NOE13311.1 response regulator [Ruegeria sp. HKCCD4318-2]NOG11147.1 response regulator transcription factor [Ruegeria sp. HKCCD4315]
MLADSARRADFKNVLIVDDHPLFCDALSMTLQTVAQIGDIHTADRLEGAMELLAQGLKPDAVMLDLNLPDVDGLDGLVRLKAAASVPVIVVSSLTDSRVVSQVIQAGASGYVPKHSQRDVFRTAIETVQSGNIFVPEGCVLIEAEDDDEHSDAVNRLATLTNQQSRILQLICEGKLNKQIAYDLSIAETTVKAHVTAIMRKLGVQSRTQAVLISKKASFASVLQEQG